MIWFIFRIILHAALLVLIGTTVVALVQVIRWLAKARAAGISRGRQVDKAGDTGRDMMALRLQAYERLVLFAERISPRQLAPRMLVPQSTARDLQYALVQAIQAEFDHNISQQIYLSPAAWEGISNAKEQLIRLINELAEALPAGSVAAVLAKKTVELEMESGESFPVQIALAVLNAEARKLMDLVRY